LEYGRGIVEKRARQTGKHLSASGETRSRPSIETYLPKALGLEFNGHTAIFGRWRQIIYGFITGSFFSLTGFSISY
jgi:hypothetical protein